MIEELTLKGFKSFFDETIKIAPLTVLTGLNSSGKSSVMQAIRMIKNHLLGGDIIIEGHGSIDELRNSHYNKDKNFSIEVKYSVEKSESQYAGYGTEARQSNGGECYPEIIYVSADRYGPRTSIPINTSHNLGSRGDNVLNCIEYYGNEPLAECLRHEQSEGDTFSYNLRAWLGAISPGVKFRSQIQNMSDSSFSLFDEHRAMNVGFGLSYTLPIIVALFMGTLKKNSIVLIENPEAHLHPKGQTEMARLICATVDAGAQVIVETHSDHLFDGIRIYAKQHPGFAKQVSTHWFELDKKKLTCVDSPIMDNEGNLNEWPEGMFDQFGINSTILLS